MCNFIVRSAWLFLFVLWGTLAAEEIDFGVKFNIEQGSSLEPFLRTLNSGIAPALSLRIGSADRKLLSKLDVPDLQSKIRSDLLFDNVLSLTKFKFSHFALFGDALVAVYRPVNALTGQLDREAERAIQEIARRLKADFKQALEKEDKITWSVVYKPYIQEVGRINDKDEVSIDYREPFFFVILKRNADEKSLQTILDFQKSLFRSPAVIKAHADQAVIFVEDHE